MNIEVAFVMWLVTVMFAGANMTLVQELEANCCCPNSMWGWARRPPRIRSGPFTGCSERRPICIREFCCNYSGEFNSEYCSTSTVSLTCYPPGCERLV